MINVSYLCYNFLVPFCVFLLYLCRCCCYFIFFKNGEGSYRLLAVTCCSLGRKPRRVYLTGPLGRCSRPSELNLTVISSISVCICIKAFLIGSALRSDIIRLYRKRILMRTMCRRRRELVERGYFGVREPPPCHCLVARCGQAPWPGSQGC